jgi:hypothetical protein
MAEEQSLSERFTQWVKDNHDRQPSLSAELGAMGREAVKDARETIHQSWFGQGEGRGEPGAPLNPTMQEVTNERETLGDYNQLLDQHAGRDSGPAQDRGLGR